MSEIIFVKETLKIGFEYHNENTFAFTDDVKYCVFTNLHLFG